MREKIDISMTKHDEHGNAQNRYKERNKQIVGAGEGMKRIPWPLLVLPLDVEGLLEVKDQLVLVHQRSIIHSLHGCRRVVKSVLLVR